MNPEESKKYEEEVAALSFEESMSQLERLVERLETGGADLNESLEIYEKAVVLRNHCKAVLDDGQKVEIKDLTGFAEKVRNKW